MIHPQAPIIYSTFQVFGPFPAGPCRIRPRAIPSNRSFLSDHFSQHHISCTWELHLRVQKVTSAQHNRQTLIYIYIHAHMCTFLLLEVRIHMYSTLQYINMSPMFLVVLFSISTHTYNIYIYNIYSDPYTLRQRSWLSGHDVFRIFSALCLHLLLGGLKPVLVHPSLGYPLVLILNHRHGQFPSILFPIHQWAKNHQWGICCHVWLPKNIKGYPLVN